MTRDLDTLDRRLLELRGALAGLGPEGLYSVRRLVALERAEIELLRVQRIELARLLVAAAGIGASRSPIPERLGIACSSAATIARWREEVRELLAEVDPDPGVRAAEVSCRGVAREAVREPVREPIGEIGARASRLLARLSSRPIERWPSAVRLARAAAALDPSEGQRRALALALLSEGRWSEAKAAGPTSFDLSPALDTP